MFHGGGWWSYIRYDEERDRPQLSWSLLKRVWGYATPYRLKTVGLLITIFVITGLSLIPPLLYRDLIDNALPNQDVTPETFRFRLIKDKLRKVRKQEGQYLLRSNLVGEEASTLWKYYTQLVEVEQAFKTLKMDLSLRPVYHQKDERIEAHIFVAFLSYCLQVTLQQRLKALAPGLTVRSVLEKFASIQLVDVHLPTTDGRELRLPRYTEPNKEQLLLLSRLSLKLPPQPRPELLDKKPEITKLKMNV